MNTLLTLAAFWSLVAFTALSAERRAQLRARTASEWCLDVVSLSVQGILVPIVLVAPLFALFARLWPEARGAWQLPGWASFALAFVVVDYVYYWNHRLLHVKALWPLHQVHHSARHMDVFVTSRNTLWTSFAIIYLWASSTFTFLLADPAPYLLGAGLTAGLDLARHAPLDLSRFPRLQHLLGLVFILPRDHALHHADAPEHGNYGANFALWDRLHGTYLGARPVPKTLGVEHDLSLARSLFWPYSR